VRIETFVPWNLVKRGAKKMVVTPGGALEPFQMEGVPPQDVGMATPDLKALGLAHYWQHLLDTDKVGSLREIAAAEGIDLGQVSRMARLAWMGTRMVEGKFGAPLRPRRKRSAAPGEPIDAATKEVAQPFRE